MDEEFLKAAKTGNIDKVTECIEKNIDIHVTNPGGLNALHFACRENYPEIAKLVLKHGIDIHRITKRLNTALHIAALGGHTEVAQILIDNGAPVNVRAKDDITPLYMAAQENHKSTVKLLLAHGADPHMTAKGGFEPSDIAVQQGHSKVTAMLLEHDTKQGLRALHVATKKDDIGALKLLIHEKWNVNERASNGYTPLHIAAKHGSINAANYLVDQGAELNTPAKHNIVPLHVAARHGQSGVLTILIEAGANLSLATKDGLSALHCAVRDGHSRCVELLLVHGAPITAKTRHGLTALHTASQGNHTTSANHLLTHGAHIDDITLDGVTPLHITAHYGHLETAQLLIEKGADIDKRAKNGYTALHIASKKNHENIVQLLLQHKSSVHIKNNNGQTALHVAAFFGHVNIVLLLLQSGASPEAKTIREETVIHIACRTTQIQIVRLLIRNNANVNAVSKEQDTPLHIACLQGSSGLVSLLLDNGADPNAINMEGCSALHLAARDGHETIVESLLDHHADVTLMSKRGFTPLHEASKKGHVEIMNMLLAKKADVNAKGKNDLTPLHVACHYDQPDAAIKLLSHGANPHDVAKNGFTCVHISSNKNQVNIVSVLLERGVEANMMTRNGIAPLHLAAREGNVEIVDMLLEHGASPGAQTVNGLTPLHMAVQYNQIEVVQTLIKYGAAVNIPTQTGFTPLHLAAMFGHANIAELLLNDNAEVEAKTKNGNTALHIASHHGHEKVIDLLLRFNAPPNALNKDGLSALNIAEALQIEVVVKKLVHVTKITLSKKYNTDRMSNSPKSKWEKVRQSFLSPERLEEPSLVDAVDEAEDEAHIQKKIIQEDFEETFAGLDESRSETRSELNKSIHTVVEEQISFSGEHQLESMAGGEGFNHYLQQLEVNDPSSSNVESFIQGLDNSNALTSEKSPVKSSNGEFICLDNRDMNSFQHIDRDDYKNKFSSGGIHFKESELPKSALKESGFLISFLVDAHGGVMESRQTGIKITVPKGACCMPTRMTCRLKRPDVIAKRHNLHLNFNESLVSKVAYISPEDTQFLKPVVMEIPHYAAMNNPERELVVLRKNANDSRWQEHSTTLFDKLSGHKLKVIVQDLPEMLVIISRPVKQRCVMQPEGGTINSQAVANTKIIIPPNTLNTSTRVILQVQPCDERLLQLDNDQTYLSPIVSLMPNTVLSKPITINIPCPWLSHEEKTARKNLRLLSWLTKSPRKSFSGVVEYEWQDITNKTPLSIVGENASFTTTDFTRYWLLQTNSVETLTKRINQIQETVSVAPYSSRIRVFAREKSEKSAILRLELSLDNTYNNFSRSIDHTFQEIGSSELLSVYRNQTVYVNVSGNLSPQTTQALKLNLKPFFVNRLTVPVTVIDVETPKKCRLTFLGTLRNNDRQSVPTLCVIDVDLSNVVTKSSPVFPDDTVNDSIIKSIGDGMRDDWLEFADELDLNNRDKQAICDISCGRHDIASIRLLEFWRSKHPPSATYKKLYDSLKRFGKDDLTELVVKASPTDFSLDVEPRTQSLTKNIADPFLNMQFLTGKNKTSPSHTQPTNDIPKSTNETPKSTNETPKLTPNEEKIDYDQVKLKDPEFNFDSVHFDEPIDEIDGKFTDNSFDNVQIQIDESNHNISMDSTSMPFEADGSPNQSEADGSPNQSDFNEEDTHAYEERNQIPKESISEDLLNEVEIREEESSLDFNTFLHNSTIDSTENVDVDLNKHFDEDSPNHKILEDSPKHNVNVDSAELNAFDDSSAEQKAFENITEQKMLKKFAKPGEVESSAEHHVFEYDGKVELPSVNDAVESAPESHLNSENFVVPTSTASQESNVVQTTGEQYSLHENNDSINVSNTNNSSSYEETRNSVNETVDESENLRDDPCRISVNDNSGDEIIKKMFSNQTSVLEFFNNDEDSIKTEIVSTASEKQHIQTKIQTTV